MVGKIFGLGLVIFFVCFSLGCVDSQNDVDDGDIDLFVDPALTVDNNVGQGSSDLELSEFQSEACIAADEAGTCETRLPDLQIVTVDECCLALGKCC